MSKSKRSKACNFTKGVEARIVCRDEDKCIFCAAGRWPLPPKDFGRVLRDIAHVVNKSQGGLGVEQNGVTSCRSHHHMLDNGNGGAREEMIEFAKDYLRERYPDWDESKLVYQKGV